MPEYKISLMRNFGTEQFSMTASFDKAPTDKEIEKTITQISYTVDKQFKEVQGREISEKLLIAERSKERQDAIESYSKQLQSEADAAKKLGKVK